MENGSLVMKSVKNSCSRIQGVYSSHHFLWINFDLSGLYVIISIIYQSYNSDILLNLYFSGIPGCVVKGVASNPLFQIFLDPALAYNGCTLPLNE